jgi:hypothetical protein
MLRYGSELEVCERVVSGSVFNSGTTGIENHVPMVLEHTYIPPLFSSDNRGGGKVSVL